MFDLIQLSVFDGLFQGTIVRHEIFGNIRELYQYFLRLLDQTLQLETLLHPSLSLPGSSVLCLYKYML